MTEVAVHTLNEHGYQIVTINSRLQQFLCD